MDRRGEGGHLAIARVLSHNSERSGEPSMGPPDREGLRAPSERENGSEGERGCDNGFERIPLDLPLACAIDPLLS